MSRAYDRDRDPSLEDRLRRDAPGWGGQPSAACREQLRVLAEQMPDRSGRRSIRARAALYAAAAALVILGTLVWSPWSEGEAPALGPSAGWPRAGWSLPGRAITAEVDWITLAPLERELDDVTTDAVALADAMWGRVPPRVRRLFD